MFNYAGFLSYIVITAVTPGPNNILSMANAARLGFRKSFTFNLGIGTGFLAVMLICTFLCDMVSAFLPGVTTTMIFMGSIYMLWLAWKIFRSSPELDDDSSDATFAAGVILQFINPKIYIYCIISMQAYILPVYPDQPAILAFFAFLLAFTGFIFSLCWALFGSLFKLLFSKYYRITNTVMAVLLACCAVSLFFYR